MGLVKAKIFICKNCDVHIGRAIIAAKEELIPSCYCVHNETCERQYLSNDDTVRTCFHGFWSRLMTLYHNQPKSSKREDNEKHCQTCQCACNCGDSSMPHNSLCPVEKNRGKPVMTKK